MLLVHTSTIAKAFSIELPRTTFVSDLGFNNNRRYVLGNSYKNCIFADRIKKDSFDEGKERDAEGWHYPTA
jgi:hypothetical protein